MNAGNVYLYTMYVPCGNLDDAYINLQLKLKTMQLLTKGDFELSYMDADIGLSEFLQMVNAEYDPDIKMITLPGTKYDKETQSFVFTFKMIPRDEYVEMNDYYEIDTERFIALGLYLEATDDGDGNYDVNPSSRVDVKSTFEQMPRDFDSWYPFVDMSEENLCLENILKKFESAVMGVVYIGEVAVVIFDSVVLYEMELGLPQDLDDTEEDDSFAYNYLPYVDGTKELSEEDEREINDDKGWSSF